MDLPPGYLITWTAYGSWLHGDARGSVDSRHNEYATEHLRPSPSLQRRRSNTLAHEPYLLGPTARSVVEQSVRRHADHRGWGLRAVSARTSHVHVVVQEPPVRPEVMLKQFKDWATRDLRRHGLLAEDRPAWTAHGSTIWLWNTPSLDAAARYVMERQDGDGYWQAHRRLLALEREAGAERHVHRPGQHPSDANGQERSSQATIAARCQQSRPRGRRGTDIP